MTTRDDFIKKLHEDSLFKQALAKAKDAKEREAITRIVENMVGSFANVLAPAIDRAKNDPVFVEQLKRALVGGEQVVTAVEPEVSGSGGAK